MYFSFAHYLATEFTAAGTCSLATHEHYVSRAWTWCGSVLQVSSDSVAQKLGVTSGALLSGLQPDGPAAAAGLLATRRGLGGVIAGDVIVAVNGRQVLNGGDLFNALELYKVGDKVKLTVIKTTDQVSGGAWYAAA